MFIITTPPGMVTIATVTITPTTVLTLKENTGLISTEDVLIAPGMTMTVTDVAAGSKIL
jgi:hypothetical protein